MESRNLLPQNTRMMANLLSFSGGALDVFCHMYYHSLVATQTGNILLLIADWRSGSMFTDDGAVTVLSKISNISSRGILTEVSKLRMERRLYTISEKSLLITGILCLLYSGLKKINIIKIIT